MSKETQKPYLLTNEGVSYIRSMLKSDVDPPTIGRLMYNALTHEPYITQNHHDQNECGTGILTKDEFLELYRLLDILVCNYALMIKTSKQELVTTSIEEVFSGSMRSVTLGAISGMKLTMRMLKTVYQYHDKMYKEGK